MTDYLQKAREAAFRHESYTHALATTLEALDKAEAERDALLEVVHMAKLELGSHGPCVACSNAHSILTPRALIQPEPDPLEALEKACIALCDSGCNGDRGDHEPECKKAWEAFELARHGLAVKEVG